MASRSSIASKGVVVTGGVVDPDYRGNIGVILYNHSPCPFDIAMGEAIAQLVWEHFTSVDVRDVESLEANARCELPPPPGELPGGQVVGDGQ